jgi:hypothetical protein
MVLRTLYLAKRALTHLRVMDFSIIPGKSGWIAHRLGLVAFWRRHLWNRHPRPAAKPRPAREIQLIGAASRARP